MLACRLFCVLLAIGYQAIKPNKFFNRIVIQKIYKIFAVLKIDCNFAPEKAAGLNIRHARLSCCSEFWKK